MPLNIEVSKLPFPEATISPFAITWKAYTIVWGGGITPLSAFYIHESGKWTLKNAVGDAPEAYMPFAVSVHRIDTRMLVFGARGQGQNLVIGQGSESAIYSLDLDAFRWSRLHSTGTGPSDLHQGMSSWVHDKRVYFFGGARMGKLNRANDLFCFNPRDNSWGLENQGRDIPSPRESCQNVISGDTIFLYGGYSAWSRYNDLHILDMETKLWKKVHGNLTSGMVRNEPCDSKLTLITQSSAILFGSFTRYTDAAPVLEDDCWHLSLENAKQMTNSSKIWSRFRSHLVRSLFTCVLEPVTLKLWVIGGRKSPPFIDINGYTTDVLEVSFNISSLRNILLEYVSRFISCEDRAVMPSHFPIALKKEIESYREQFLICGAEKGCHVCQYSKEQNN